MTPHGANLEEDSAFARNCSGLNIFKDKRSSLGLYTFQRDKKASSGGTVVDNSTHNPKI